MLINKNETDSIFVFVDNSVNKKLTEYSPDEEILGIISLRINIFIFSITTTFHRRINKF